jgi:hypothetical protein
VPAEFDGEGRLIELEVLDASDVLQDNVQFEVDLDVPTSDLAQRL